MSVSGYTATAAMYAQQCKDSTWGASNDTCDLYGACVADGLQRNYANMPAGAIETSCYSQYVLHSVNPPPVETPPPDEGGGGHGGISLPPVQIPTRPPDLPPVNYNDRCFIAALRRHNQRNDCPERYFIGNGFQYRCRPENRSSFCQIQ